MPLAFLSAIAVGTALLLLPISRNGDDSAPFVEAIFTATSGVCVTGLTVVDVSTYWSGFGQLVLICLVQIGGFGIMTLASLLSLAVAGRLGLRERLAAQVETKGVDLGNIRNVVLRVAVVVVIVESVAAVVLSLRFYLGYGYEFGTAVWHGIFHAVSAFNSAGFALHTDSLETFIHDPVVTVPVAVAALIGGIGFPVIVELVRRTFRPSKWTLHTKITLMGSAVLLAVGFATYLVVEWDNAHTLGPMTLLERVHAASFSAVMPRSAGYNILPIPDLKPETWAITDVLMFIGGGSAGTAGGIKVSTFFVLAFVIWAELRGEPDVSMFGRTIPAAAQRSALTVALLGVGCVAVGTIALMAVSNLPFDVLLFDATSAFGTVGLSSGATGALNDSGHLILVALMFTGRVGTVTLGAALALRARHRRFRFPDSRPIIG